MTADHGEEFQEHGMLTHGTHLYQESLRVPLVISGPRVPVGRRTDLVQGIDLFPTLAGYLEIPLPAGLPGQDLLAGPEARPAVSETARGIAPDGKPMDVVSVVMADWKLIQSPVRLELYDLRRDPGERENRFGAAEGERLKAALARWQETAPAPREQPPTIGLSAKGSVRWATCSERRPSRSASAPFRPATRRSPGRSPHAPE